MVTTVLKLLKVVASQATYVIIAIVLYRSIYISLIFLPRLDYTYTVPYSMSATAYQNIDVDCPALRP